MSTVEYDVSKVFPPSPGAGEDDYSATIDDAVASYGYVGGALRNRNATGSDESIIFWQQIGGASGSGTILDTSVAFPGAADRFHFVDVEAVDTSPRFLVVYTQNPGAGNVQLKAAALSGQTITASAISVNSSTPSASGHAAVTSSSTAYIAYGSNLYKSTNINTGAPTWSNLGTIGPGGINATVVRGGLAVVSGSVYAIVWDGTTTLTAYKSTNDGASWASLGTISSSARGNAGGPLAQIKSALVWTVAYVSNVDSSLRLSLSTDGGATWVERFVSAVTPTSFDLLAAHASHFCLGWTTSTFGSSAALPTYSESVDRGLTWNTPTVDASSGGKPAAGDFNFNLGKVTHGIGLMGGAAYTSTPLGGLDGGVSLATSSYPAPDHTQGTGRDLLQFVLVARTSAAGGPSNSEPAYLVTGGWLTSEGTVDPDYFTNTSQDSVSALDEGANAAQNSDVSAIDEGLSPYVQANVSALDEDTSPSTADTLKYQALGFEAIFPRRTGAARRDYTSVWWPITPDLSAPPTPEVGLAAIPFKRDYVYVGTTLRAGRDVSFPFAELSIPVALRLRRSLFNPGVALGPMVVALDNQNGHGDWMTPAQALELLRARSRTDDEEALFLLLCAAVARQ